MMQQSPERLHVCFCKKDSSGSAKRGDELRSRSILRQLFWTRGGLGGLSSSRFLPTAFGDVIPVLVQSHVRMATWTF